MRMIPRITELGVESDGVMVWLIEFIGFHFPDEHMKAQKGEGLPQNQTTVPRSASASPQGGIPQFLSYFPTISPHSIAFPTSLTSGRSQAFHASSTSGGRAQSTLHTAGSSSQTHSLAGGEVARGAPLLLPQQTLSGCVRGISLFCSHRPLWSSQPGSLEVSRTHTRSVVPEARKAVRGAGHGITTQDTDVCLIDAHGSLQQRYMGNSHIHGKSLWLCSQFPCWVYCTGFPASLITGRFLPLYCPSQNPF